MEADIEHRGVRNLLEAVEGIVGHNDLGSLIFRRFDKLAILNILSLQEKLAVIDRSEFSEVEQYNETLKEYRTSSRSRVVLIGNHTTDEAILRYKEVLEIRRPSPRAVEDLDKMLTEMNARKSWKVTGDDRRVPSPDVIALSAEADPLTRYISRSYYLRFIFMVSMLAVLSPSTIS